MRAWRAANPEKAAAADKRRAAAVKANPERLEQSRATHARWKRQRYQTHREDVRRHQRNSYLRCTYGIEPEEYDAMLEAQGGHCAICPATEPGGGKAFFPVDHCHVTGRKRGLLCDRCNRGIGLLGDDVEVVESAASYLRAFAVAAG